MMLRKLLDNVEQKILSNEKLKKFHPLHDALDTFLYSTNTKTEHAPYVRDAIDLKRTMILVVLALLPAFFFGTYNVGLQSPEVVDKDFLTCFLYGLKIVLPMYLIVFAVGGLFEAIFAVIRGHEINEGFLVTGFLIPLTMPPTVPLWMLAVATIFGVVIGKEIFGGTGYNIFNPALTARAFLFFAYPSYMSGNKPWIAPLDGLSQATPLLQKSSNLDITYSWWDMFYGYIPGSVGETSTLAILIGAFVLLITGIGSWRVMLSTCLGLIFTSTLLNQLTGVSDNPMLGLTALEHFVMGGFAFGMVFMATDPVSSAQTNKGRWFYGLLIGFMAIVIRCINPAYPEGMMLAILFANAFAPLFDYFVIQSHVKGRQLSYEE
ncbi:MAG: NADH:ubiquinone reductase (Na(+)-transporting) subunit B [Candidatus Marinimicrobia bacterium]|nr:NADH:ubiquinone reductase (Na(+)-transporting) subunit B [Candidatus Neomarinimicrobiota bacterium]